MQNQPGPYNQFGQGQPNYPNQPQNNLPPQPNPTNYAQGYERNQNLVHNQPNFAPPQPYPPQYPPQSSNTPRPKKKSRWKGILVLLLVFVLVGGGVGAYLFYDYTTKVQQAEATLASIKENYQTYDQITQDTKESFKEMENTEYVVTSQETFVADLINLDQTLGEEVAALESLKQEHEEGLENLDAGSVEQTQEYQKEVSEQLANSQAQLEQVLLGYQSFECINQKLIQINDLTAEIEAVAQKYPNQEETVNLDRVSDTIVVMDKYVTTFEEFQACFDDTGGLYDQQVSVANLEEIKSLYVDLSQAMKDLREGTQQEDEEKVAQAKAIVDDVQARSDELQVSQDYYGVFDERIETKFDEYYDFVQESEDILRDRRDELVEELDVRGSFLPF
jgi:hypothetical protein